MSLSLSGDGVVTGLDSAASSDLGAALAAKLDTPGAWTSYTPTWTNVTVGNGTVLAKYVQVGKLVVANVQLTLGSTSSVSGNIQATLPVAQAAGTFYGSGDLTDTGIVSYPATVFATSNNLTIRAQESSATYLRAVGASSTVPFTWGTGDTITGTITYEAA